MSIQLHCELQVLDEDMHITCVRAGRATGRLVTNVARDSVMGKEKCLGWIALERECTLVNPIDAMRQNGPRMSNGECRTNRAAARPYRGFARSYLPDEDTACVFQSGRSERHGLRSLPLLCEPLDTCMSTSAVQVHTEHSET